ncbi:MAG: ATP-dependent Clp protease ATP-binding subunit ClpX [Lachnospiraceae bacterium]|nr:ATP-dependent Clp protease ATP-binding subunit ClpX [Lachnospiraceae bacterium]
MNEEFCSICHRSSKDAGSLIHMPGNMNLCHDCMQSTVNSLSSMNIPGFGSGIKPDFFSADLSKTGNSFVNPVTSSDTAKPKTDETVKEEGDKSDKESNDKEADSKSNTKNNNYGIPNISFLNMSDFQNLLNGGRSRVKKKKNVPDEERVPLINIKDIPEPHKLKAMLDEYVVGQEHAKRIVSVGVYNHYKRVASQGMKKEQFDDDLFDIEIEKSNMLMIGPTGCGKTYLVKTLAKLLDVPLAIADATSLTEAGYIGDDIESVVGKLLAAADNDVEKAEIGIIYIDEIDKLAKKKDTHTRDINGESVQQGMLKLLEGADIEVPVGSNSKNAMVPLETINTSNILFICGGAFPELDEIIKQRLRKQTSIGFNAELKDQFDKRKDILSLVKTEDIKKYGFIPEFIGRLPIVYTMEGLTKEMLVNILKEPKNALIKQYKKLFALDEVKLEFDDEALELIAEKAYEKDTGARALRSIVEEYMFDIMYEIPKDKNIGRVVITKDYIEGKGGPLIEMRTL